MSVLVLQHASRGSQGLQLAGQGPERRSAFHSSRFFRRESRHCGGVNERYSKRPQLVLDLQQPEASGCCVVALADASSLHLAVRLHGACFREPRHCLRRFVGAGGAGVENLDA